MRRPPERERGLTFISVLLVLALLGGIYWIFTFAGVNYDNHEVKAVLRQAGNIAYQQKEDKKVREWIMRELDSQFGYDGTDAAGHSARLLKLEFDENDLVLTRTQSPPNMHIDLHYARTITLPIFGSQRRLSFDDHVDQDLSSVKW